MNGGRPAARNIRDLQLEQSSLRAVLLPPYPRFFYTPRQRMSQFVRRSPSRPFLPSFCEVLEPRALFSTLIPILDHRDLVFDNTRDLLYVTTSSGTVQRYDPAARQLIAPLTLGGQLNGADITPDGHELIVANETAMAFQRIRLADGTVTKVGYERESGEGGGFDIAVTSNGT